MANNVVSLQKLSLNLKSVNYSFTDTSRTLSNVNKSVEKISKIISDNTRNKNILYEKNNIINARRRDASRRQEIEDQAEAKNVSVLPQRGLTYTKTLSRGPLSRLLGFLGFITAGWIANNLPTWIFMGKEFISRIYKFGGSLYTMVDDIKRFTNYFGDTLKFSLDAIVRLDFNEFTEGKVLESFNSMTETLGDLGESMNAAFEIFKKPLTESLDTGQQAPPLGSQRTESLFPGVTQQSMGQLSDIHRRALDIISGPESGGSYNAMNQGTINRRIVGSTLNSGSRESIGKPLTSMTIGEIMQRQAYLMNRNNPQISKYGIYAAGKYQIIPDTMKEAVKNAGLSPSDMFSPENQDKLGLAVLRSQGIRAWTAGGSSYSSSERAIIEQARNTPVTYTTSQAPAQQSSTSGLSGSATFIQGSTGVSSGDHFHIGPDYEYYGKPQGYAAAREGAFVIAKNLMSRKIPFTFSNWWGFKSFWYNGGPPKSDNELRDAIQKEQTAHTTRPSGSSFAGIDIAAPQNTKIPGILDVKFIPNGFGVQGRIAGTNAFVGHGAYGSTSGSDTSLGQVSASPNKENQLQSQQPATITAPAPPIPQITPEREGSNIVLMDMTQSPQPVTVPQPSYPMMQPMTVGDFDMLNNFIKNKLLLDLAYL